MASNWSSRLVHTITLTWNGRKVWAVGSRVDRKPPPNETFHEFILYVLGDALGESWDADQAALPKEEQHLGSV
jgi:hypothetical protein